MIRAMRTLSQRTRWFGACLVLALGMATWVIGCVAPSVTEMPPVAPGGASVRTSIQDAGPDYQPLALSGVRGGKLRFDLPGTVDAVVDMLLDFDHMNGKRPWAKHYRTIKQTEARTLAEWTFRGKLGIAPKVELEYRLTRARGSATIRFHLTKKAFGVAAYFGEFRLVPAGANRVSVVAQVFIDSGLIFVNASAKDIEKGLREDAKQLAQWIQDRLHQH